MTIDPTVASVSGKIKQTWNALLHPRGRDGRFISKGDDVVIYPNEHSHTPVVRGDVIGIGKDSVTMRVTSSSLPKVPPGTVLSDVPSEMVEQSAKFRAKLRPPVPPGQLRPGEEIGDIAPKAIGMKVAGSLADNLTPTKNGSVISAERKKLHDQIIDEMFAGKTLPDNPELVVLGGGVASGKTTVLDSGQGLSIDPGTTIELAADKIKEKLPEYQKMLEAKDPRAAAFTHEESSYIAARAERRAIREGYSIVYDGTGDGALWASNDRIQRAREHGYATKGLYVTIPVPTAIARNKARARVTGRLVPEPVLRRTHEAVSDIFPKVVNNLDDAELWDNTGDTPVLIGSKHGAADFSIERPDLWTQFLDKAPGRSMSERTPGQVSTFHRDPVDVPNADKSPDLSGDIKFRRGVSQEGRDLNGIPLHEDTTADFQSIPDADVGEPPVPPDPRRLRQSAGVIIKEPDGRIWIYEPNNHFGGYEHTFSKGGVEQGDTMQQAALREAFEEMGLKAKITGYLHDYKGSTTMTRMYTGERIGGAPWIHDMESHNVKLVSPDTARQLLNTERDQLILADLTGNTSVSGARAVTGPSALARLIIDGGFVMTPQGVPQPAGNFTPVEGKSLHTDLNTLKTNPGTYEQWRDANLDLLMQPGTYIGSSLDPTTDEIIFEIVQEPSGFGSIYDPTLDRLRKNPALLPNDVNAALAEIDTALKPKINAEMHQAEALGTIGNPHPLIVDGWDVPDADIRVRAVGRDGGPAEVPEPVQRSYANVQNEVTALAGRAKPRDFTLYTENQLPNSQGHFVGFYHLHGGAIDVDVTRERQADPLYISHTFVHEAAHAWAVEKLHMKRPSILRNDESQRTITSLESMYNDMLAVQGKPTPSLYSQPGVQIPAELSLVKASVAAKGQWKYGSSSIHEFIADMVAHSVLQPDVVRNGVLAYGWDPAEIDRIVGEAIQQPDFSKVSDAVANVAVVAAAIDESFVWPEDFMPREGEPWQEALVRMGL